MFFQQEWYLNYIRLKKLHQQYGQGLGKKILVIGTGCTIVPGLETVTELPSVVPNDLPGDESQVGHETAVCSVIQRIAPKARIYSLDVSGTTLSYHLEGWKKIIEWYPQYKWDFINCSFNSGNTDEYKEPIKQLTAMGAVVVAATGNDGASMPGYPAAWSKDGLVIAIGGCTKDGLRWVSSNDGHDILLPCVDIKCLWKHKIPKYTYFMGTSIATPIASGMLAVMKRTSMTAQEGKTLLRNWMYNK